MSKKKKNKTTAPDNNRGPTWVGFYPRLTKSLKDKELQEERKNKQKVRYVDVWEVDK